MKIGIQTWGSHGDIRPFIALGEGLQQVGHEVTLVITSIDNDHYRRLDIPSGMTIKMVSSPVISDDTRLRKIEEAIFSERDPIMQTQMIIEQLFLPAEAEMFEASSQLCAESDLVIGHFFHYPLNAAAQQYGRPYASVALVHSAVPSTFQPPSGVPDLGTFGNRIAWSLVKAVMNKKIKKYSDRLRIKNGIKTARDLINNVWASDHLTLIAVSQSICKRMRDWPAHYRVCGFLAGDGLSIESDVPDGLQRFLSDGQPAIYMTFGSVMSGNDGVDSISLLLDAAKLASMRAVIQAPGWESCGFKSSDTVYFVTSAPHRAVFPQCSTIVHHGGAGTSQAAILAGKPSIVVAHTSEQGFWGRELQRIGVAPRPLSRRSLTPKRLAKSIEFATRSDGLKEKAKQLGTEMAKENGVRTAVKWIDEMFNSK
ncbi:MAG: hypothetical protein OEW08_03675 [Gammaproteobacteria bacterium]|nr:hypothetical protein [Gammaproteobacteria bacterium]